MAVKTDMSKAYDNIEWKFIEAVLGKFGFHPKVTNWIMQCVSTVSYSIILNGLAQGKNFPKRGIRQGDPISLYLFILCSEVLSGLCRKAQNNGSVVGLRVAKRSPQINNLLFAEDTMFFCKASKRNYEPSESSLRCTSYSLAKR